MPSTETPHLDLLFAGSVFCDLVFAGVPVPEIMRRLRLSRPTVTHWLRRFEHAGVDGLADRARPGRPSRISPEALRHIAMVVGARPRDLGIQGTRWSLARLRRYLVQTGTVPTLSLELLRITLKRLGLGLTASRAGQIQKGVTTMIPGAFEYHSPSSLGEATALLAKLGDDAKVLSGGQSLIPLMKLRLAAWIDPSPVPATRSAPSGSTR